MSNEYYNNDTKITPFTKASSSDVDADFDAIATGFDKLPEPHASAPVTKGFAEVFEIVDGTDEAHPAPISQIRDAVFYGTCAGSANTYAITLTPAPSAYTAGMTILFKPSASNTGASTVNVNSLGARNVKSTFGADPGANEIYASNYALMTYDGTNFILLNPAGGTTGSVVTTDDVDDTPVNGETTAPISSNWAHDHVASENPHPKFSGLVIEYDGTPATVAIGTGAKTFDTGKPGKAFVAGMKIVAARWSTPTTQWMYGSVTSYNSTTGELVMNSELFNGSGSYSGWLIYVSGEIVAPGVGQTWTDVLSGRSIGTAYTNSTGKPIIVSIQVEATDIGYIWLQAGPTTASENEITIGAIFKLYTSTSTHRGNVVGVIPIGWKYRVGVTPADGIGSTLHKWLELR